MKKKATKKRKHNDLKCKKDQDEGKLNATIKNTKEKSKNPTSSYVNVVKGKSVTCSQTSPVEEVIKGGRGYCDSDADMNYNSEVTSDPTLMNLSYAGAVKGEYLKCWKSVYCCVYK